jgi:hypothetical protein
MMVDPDTFIQTSRGNYQSFFFDLVDDATGLPVNLTGYTLEATFRERGTGPLLLTTVTGAKLASADPPSGRIQLVINEADTLLLPSRDLSYCGCPTDPQYTCFCQIDGTISGKRYQLATIAIDNISSTVVGGA